MKLSVKERLELGGLFPEWSDEMSQVIMRDINLKVRLTQEEMEQIKLKRESGRDEVYLKWEEGVLEEKEFTLTNIELKFLKDQRERCNEEKKISQGMLSLCLKIQKEELIESTSDKQDTKGKE